MGEPCVRLFAIAITYDSRQVNQVAPTFYHFTRNIDLATIQSPPYAPLITPCENSTANVSDQLAFHCQIGISYTQLLVCEIPYPS